MSETARRVAPQLQAAPQTPVPTDELLAIVREYIDGARFGAAERLLGHVLAARPEQSEALHLLGFIAFKQDRPEQAVSHMRHAMRVGTTSPRQLCNLAEVCRVLGRVEEGLELTRRAAALAPTDPICHFNEAMLHYDRQDVAACVRASRRAINLRHDMAEAHMRLGQALLLGGEFPEGWREYEWRYQIAGAQPLMPKSFAATLKRPQWNGEPLGPGQTLLLIGDQGFGDVLMFARYIGWAAARCASVVVACSTEIAALLARVFPGPRYTIRWDDIGDHACYCPLSGLPRLAGTTFDNIPAPTAYLTADPARREAMRRWLEEVAPRPGLRVGIAWAGRPTHNNDRNRSIRLEQLAPVLDAPGVSLVSLQKGPAAAQLAAWQGHPIADASGRLHSFEDTVALADCLDLVVAVDTSVGHVAGGLGKPAWVMLPFAPDWRWLTDRADSPWYPTLRLYRQAQPGHWPAVIEAVAGDLRRLVAGEAAQRLPSSARIAARTPSG